MIKVVTSALVLVLFALAACTVDTSPPPTPQQPAPAPTSAPASPGEAPTAVPPAAPATPLPAVPAPTAMVPPPAPTSVPSATSTPRPIPSATSAPSATSTPTVAPATSTPTADDPLTVAIEGVGGEDALAQLSSFVIDASIFRYTTGEGLEPNFEPDAPIVISAMTSYDVDGDNLRLDYVREGAGLESTYSEIINGNLAYMIGRDARFGSNEGSNLTPDRMASTRKQQRLLNPQLILKDAMSNPDMVSEVGAEEIDGIEHSLLQIDDDVFPITLFVNSETGTISKLATMENDHWLRDVVLEVSYFDWQASDNGLMFPNNVTIVLDETIVHEETRNSVEANVSIDDAMFEFPEGADPSFDAELALLGETSSQSIQMFSARGFPQPMGLTTIAPNEVAPGIFHLGGSSHNSLVIEQENGIVIAEAPLYPGRSEAVIAWVEEQFPDKPITHVISSHHHRDHSSGLRSYVARGITVVMGEGAVGIFEEIFDRPSTVLPDALEDSPTEPIIEAIPVGETFEIADTERPVTAGAIPSTHATDTVFTHVSGGDVVFMGDGGAQTPELLAALEQLKLSASTFAGGHGGPVPFE